MAELAATAPGVAVRSNGGFGQLTTISIRGSSSRRRPGAPRRHPARHRGGRRRGPLHHPAPLGGPGRGGPRRGGGLLRRGRAGRRRERGHPPGRRREVGRGGHRRLLRHRVGRRPTWAWGATAGRSLAAVTGGATRGDFPYLTPSSPVGAGQPARARDPAERRGRPGWTPGEGEVDAGRRPAGRRGPALLGVAAAARRAGQPHARRLAARGAGLGRAALVAPPLLRASPSRPARPAGTRSST